MFKVILFVGLLLTFTSAQGMDGDTIQAQQAEMSMRRTACLVLSRYHSNNQKQVIQGMISNIPAEAQQKCINKMYAMAIEHCLPTISMDQTQKFFVEDPTFNPSEMFYIFDGFDYSAAAQNYDGLTKNQQSLVKFMKNFDEEMQVRREQKDAEKDGAGQQNFEMKFFGLKAQDVPTSAKTIYIVVFAVILCIGIAYGFKKIDTPKKQSKSSSKRRASPKKTN